jgi:hypothetical protein
MINRWTIAVAVWVMIVLITLIVALPDIFSIVYPPPAPQLIREKSWLLPEPNLWGNYLRLAFSTENPDAFLVRLTSRYWVNRDQSIHQSPSFPEPGVLIRLERLNKPAVDDQRDGEIEVIYPRSILGRKLRPEVIEKFPLRSIPLPR